MSQTTENSAELTNNEVQDVVDSQVENQERKEETVQLITDPIEKELLLLELQALGSLMGAIYHRPKMTKATKKSPPEQVGTMPMNIYSFQELISMRSRADYIMKQLGLSK